MSGRRGQAFGRARIDALRAGIIEATGVPLLGEPTESALPGQLRGAPTTVVVVGAGLAGLATANFLDRLGYDVVVLEGRDDVGGRVRTADAIPGRNFSVELGAELIGWNFAVWIALAEELGLTVAQLGSEWDRTTAFSPQRPEHGALDASDTEDDDQHPTVDPVKLPDKALEDTPHGLIRDGIRILEQRLAVLAAFVAPYQPWTDMPGAAGLPKEFDDVSLADWIDEQFLDGQSADDVKLAFRTKYANDNVVETEQQSLLAVLAQIAGGGLARAADDTETSRCAQGNQALATALAHKLCPVVDDTRDPGATHRTTISLGALVTAVEPASGGQLRVKYQLSDQAEPDPVQAAFVVMTAPVPMWSDSDPGAHGAGSSTPLGRIHISGIDPSDYTISGGCAYKYFSHLSAPPWERDASSLIVGTGMTWESRPSDRDSDGTVLALFAGANASTQPIEEIAGRLSSVFPTFAELQTESEPVISRWDRTTDFAGWAYSCPAPTEVMTGARNVANVDTTPLGPGFIFAGEHSCPAFYGYMEGALESALLAVDLILQQGGRYPADLKLPLRAALERAARAGAEVATGSYYIVGMNGLDSPLGVGSNTRERGGYHYTKASTAGPRISWTIREASSKSDLVEFIPETHPELRLDLFYREGTPGTDVIVHPSNSTAAQRWRLVAGRRGWRIVNEEWPELCVTQKGTVVVNDQAGAADGSDEWWLVPALLPTCLGKNK